MSLTTCKPKFCQQWFKIILNSFINKSLQLSCLQETKIGLCFITLPNPNKLAYGRVFFLKKDIVNLYACLQTLLAVDEKVFFFFLGGGGLVGVCVLITYLKWEGLKKEKEKKK